MTHYTRYQTLSQKKTASFLITVSYVSSGVIIYERIGV